MAIFEGAGVAIVTPMKENLEVNYDKLEELLEEQIAGGTDAIVICGTTGESATLTEEEHMRTIKFAIDKVNHRIPVVAGTGSNSTATATQMSKEAAEAGADGILLVTPYYNKATQNGLIKHYTTITDEAKVPAILYNVPSRTGCSLAASTVAYLAKNAEYVTAIKEASGDISHAADIMHACDGAIDLYSGNDDQIVPILSLGGKGVISVLSNVAPKETHCSVHGRQSKRKLRTAVKGSAVSPCAVQRSKSDPGKSSPEPDGQRSRTASSAADRDGSSTPGSSGRRNEKIRYQTGIKTAGRNRRERKW